MTRKIVLAIIILAILAACIVTVYPVKADAVLTMPPRPPTRTATTTRTPFVVQTMPPPVVNRITTPIPEPSVINDYHPDY